MNSLTYYWVTLRQLRRWCGFLLYIVSQLLKMVMPKNVTLGGFKRRNYHSFNCLQSFIQWSAFLVDAPVSAVYDISVPNVLRPGATNVKNVFGVDFLFLSHITPITRSASITHRYVERALDNEIF